MPWAEGKGTVEETDVWARTVQLAPQAPACACLPAPAAPPQAHPRLVIQIAVIIRGGPAEVLGVCIGVREAK